jgi:hypothetical protein
MILFVCLFDSTFFLAQFLVFMQFSFGTVSGCASHARPLASLPWAQASPEKPCLELVFVDKIGNHD